jgi:hypothetical protein
MFVVDETTATSEEASFLYIPGNESYEDGLNSCYETRAEIIKSSLVVIV